MKPSSETPERIWLTGNFGTGKTEAWVSWAQWLRETSTPGTCYVLNCERDGSVERANERFADWRSNVTFTDINSWLELTEATSLYTSITAPGDLLVVDGADKPWSWVRDLFTETVNRRAGHVLDLSDPFATLPEVDMDWDVINGAYFRWFNSLIVGAQQAHLLMAGPSQPLKVKSERSAWGDTNETLDLFSKHGVRWAGQKRGGFDVQTLLLAEVTREGVALTTMKDAGGRPYLAKEIIPPLGFVTSYLVPCAGWSL